MVDLRNTGNTEIIEMDREELLEMERDPHAGDMEAVVDAINEKAGKHTQAVPENCMSSAPTDVYTIGDLHHTGINKAGQSQEVSTISDF